jgi:hypothetical protein
MRRFVGQMSLLPGSNLIMLLTGNLCNRFGHVALKRALWRGMAGTRQPAYVGGRTG